MGNFYINFKQIISSILIVAMLAGFFALIPPPKPAHAQVITFDPRNFVQNLIAAGTAVKDLVQSTLTAANTFSLVTKEYILDPIAYALANMVLRSLSNALINWIKTGGVNGSSLFVDSFLNEFSRQLDNAAGLFLEQYLGAANMNLLCSPFRVSLGNLINTSVLSHTSSGNKFFSQSARCTLSQVVSNVENFQVDFTQGGWSAWDAALQPAGNWMGSYLLSMDEFQREQNNARLSTQTELQTTGGGLLAQKQCDTSPGGYQTNCRIITPGSIVANAANQAFGIDIDRLKIADEINEVLSTAITSIIGWALSGGGGLANYNSANFPAQVPTQIQNGQTALINASPQDKALVSGASVALFASPADMLNTKSVRFTLEDGTIIGEPSGPTYSVEWNSRTVADGAHTITFSALDATGKVVGQTITRNITVDNTPPTAAVTQPQGGSTISTTANFRASATDANKITGVQFYLDTLPIGNEISTPSADGSFQLNNFNTRDANSGVPNGTYALTAEARDETGNVGKSSPISVTVANS